MSENTINAALRAMGFPQDEVTGHGLKNGVSALYIASYLNKMDCIEILLKAGANVDLANV